MDQTTCTQLGAMPVTTSDLICCHESAQLYKLKSEGNMWYNGLFRYEIFKVRSTAKVLYHIDYVVRLLIQVYRVLSLVKCFNSNINWNIYNQACSISINLWKMRKIWLLIKKNIIKRTNLVVYLSSYRPRRALWSTGETLGKSVNIYGWPAAPLSPSDTNRSYDPTGSLPATAFKVSTIIGT